MKLALNGATTMRADLETDLKVANAAGFDYLEIWAAKLRQYLNHHSREDLKGLFTRYAIPPLSINSIEHITFRDHNAYQGIKEQCKELSSIAEAIDCPYVVVVPGKLPAEAVTRNEVVEESVRVLNELGDIAADSGVSLAFEFLGQADCSVQTLDLANEIVRLVDRKNIGLVIDSFHFYAGGSTIDMIDALDPRSLYVFHINDAEDLPIDQLDDSKRLLPGLGILPLQNMVSAFRRIKYDDVASVEIFRPEYWDMNPELVAKQAFAATKRVLENHSAATR